MDMSVERSNVKVIQECLSLLEHSLEQRLTDGENFIIVSIKNSGADFSLISVDIIKDGKSLGIENYYVDDDDAVYSEGEWKTRWEGTSCAQT